MEMATLRAARANVALTTRNLSHPPRAMSPLTLGEHLDNGESDLGPASPTDAPKQTNKALSSSGSGCQSLYVQEPFVSALDGGPHLSSLLRLLTLNPPERRGHTSQEAARILKFVGTWTHPPSQSNMAGYAGRQHGNLNGDMALCKQCPYHYRNHDAEPINVVLCWRSLLGAAAPNCICQGNHSTYSLSLGGNHAQSPTPSTTNSSKGQPRHGRYGSVDGKRSSWNAHSHHGRCGPFTPDSRTCTMDAATVSPLARSIPTTGCKYSVTQSPREAPPSRASSSFLASANSGDSATPSSANQSEQALVLATWSSSRDSRRKRTRRDDSRSPSRSRSRGKKPAPRDRDSAPDRFHCIHYLRDPIKFKSCENRYIPGFRTLKTHVFEHVRHHQCDRCGMRTGKPDNLRKHQRNLVRTCKTQQIPVITPEEGQRFAAIGAAEEGKQLEDAVYFPVALFEKDKAMGVRGSQKTLMPLTCDESLGGGETASRDRGQPESSRASLRVLPAAPQPLSQAEASMDMASQVKQMKGQLAELSAAFLKQNAVLLKQNHKLNYLMAQVGSQEKPAPNTLQGAQNMLAASGPSSPGGLSERLRKENQDYEARIRQLEEQNQMLIHQLRRRDLSEEPRLPGDKEDAGPLSGNDPMGFSLNSERDAECPEGVDFEDFIHSIPSDASEADR